jgi:predicted extracellular nuclease
MQPARLLTLLAVVLALLFGWNRWQQPAAASCPAPDAGSITTVGAALSQRPGSEVGLHGRVTQVITGGPDGSVTGFWLQDDGDGNPLTPDGIYVRTAGSSTGRDALFEVGVAVLVSGRISDYFGQLQVNRVTQVVACGESDLEQVTPASIMLPEDGLAAAPLEPYLGMLVRFEQELTVSQTYFLGRYGQASLSAGGRLFQPGSDEAASDGRNLNRLIVLDDASSSENPAQVPFLQADGSVIRAGYTVSNLTGVLDWGLTGSGTSESGYRLQVSGPVEFNATGNPRSEAPADPGGNLRIASFNLENWFTALGERGARTQRELQRQQQKLTAALLPLDADVIGLIEVENDEGRALRELVDALNEQLPEADHYSTLQLPGTQINAQLAGRDLIRVALIYRPAVVLPVGPALFDTAGIHDRPPLVQAFRKVQDVQAGVGDTFGVAVAHFKSKGSCAAYDRDTGEGCWNERRMQQAQALLDFILEHGRAGGPQEVLIMGDLNSYALEAPVSVFTEAGYTDLLRQHVPARERYTYVFSPGYAGYLDHLLASPGLAASISGVSIWHVNADEPEVLGYAAARYGPDLFEPTPFRSSDHDPLLVGLNW